MVGILAVRVGWRPRRIFLKIIFISRLPLKKNILKQQQSFKKIVTRCSARFIQDYCLKVIFLRPLLLKNNFPLVGVPARMHLLTMASPFCRYIPTAKTVGAIASSSKYSACPSTTTVPKIISKSTRKFLNFSFYPTLVVLLLLA